MDSFTSTVSIKNSTFYNLNVDSSVFKITSSTVEMQDILIYSVSSFDGSSVIEVSFESQLGINGLVFRDSFLGLMNSLSSYTTLDSVEVYDVVVNDYIMLVDDNLDFVLRDSMFYRLSDQSLIYRSKGSLLKNVTFSNITAEPLIIRKSNIDQISYLFVESWTKCISIESSTVANFANSTFKNMGSSSLNLGGAIYIENSNSTVSNWTFQNNSAIKGGALYFSCLESPKWTLSISSSKFLENKATESGGAIKYDVFRPEMTNNEFVNNSAVYGPNIASYPVKIKVKNSSEDQISLNNVGSGLETELNLELALYDHDDQI